jgi:hypothetical protein
MLPVTLPQLRQNALIRADMLGAFGVGGRITPSEANDVINASVAELYDRINNGDEHYFARMPFVCTPATLPNGYYGATIPFDVYKFAGADASLGSQWVTIDRCPWEERNRLAFFPASWNLYGLPNVRYCEDGETVYFFPPALTPTQARIWYIPTSPVLVDLPVTAIWVTATAYTYGQYIQVTIGGVVYVFMCVSPGTSGGSSPAFAAAQGTIGDGSGALIWAFVGLLSQVQTSLNFVSRWDEYVTIDAAIKFKIKDERDTTELMAAKAFQTKRVTDALSKRNTSDGHRIEDIHRRNIYPLDDYGY